MPIFAYVDTISSRSVSPDIQYVDVTTPPSNTGSAEEPKLVDDQVSFISARTPKEPRPPHPNDFKRGTQLHKQALKEFFELHVESPAIFPASNNSEHVDPDAVPLDANETREKNEATLTNILDNYIEANTATVLQITIAELRKTYSNVCKAVAQIELNASTLRTNSRALSVAKKFVNGSAFDVFKVLEDFRPRPTSSLSLSPEIYARYKKWMETRVRGWEDNINKAQRIREFLAVEHSTDRRRNRAQHWEHGRAVALMDPGPVFYDGWVHPERKWSQRELRLEQDRNQALDELDLKMQQNAVKELGPAFHDFLDFRHLLSTPIFLAFDRYWERTVAWEENKRFEAKSTLTIPPIDWRQACLHGNFPQVKEERETRDWFREDVKAHPWKGFEWEIPKFWCQHIDEWEERGEERIRTINKFAETCYDLLVELGRIDGSASSNELDIFTTEDDRDFVEECALWMNIEMVFGHEDQFRRRLHDLFSLVGKRLRSNSLNKGFDALIKKQDHFRNTFMDFATVAIFFSSITATTLQFSFASANRSASATIVNLCWFASIVLSVASATNSFLGAIVHQSPEYLRPSTKFDFRFLQSWFKFIPPTLLSISGLLFLIGICAFTFVSSGTSPNQGMAIKNVTVALTSTNVLALFVMVLLAFTGIVPPVLFFASLPMHVVVLLGCRILTYPLILLNVIYYCIPTLDRPWFSYPVVTKRLEPVTDWCEAGLKEVGRFIQQCIPSHKSDTSHGPAPHKSVPSRESV